MHERGRTKITKLDDVSRENWDRYVREAASSTIYHSLVWLDAVSDEYGMNNVSLIATAGDKVVGVLPILRINNLTGKKHISLPYSMFGGPVADNVDIAQALMVSAKDGASAENAVLQISSNVDIDAESLSQHGIYRHALADDYSIELEYEDAEQHKQSGLGSGARKNLKKNEACEVVIGVGTADLREFYDLLLRHRRRLKLPTPRKNYYGRLVERLGANVLSCRIKGENMGSILFLEDAKAIYYAVPVYSDSSRKWHVADRCVWELVKYGYERGKRFVRLGSHPSGLTGLDQFKRKWANRTARLYNFSSHPPKFNSERIKTRGLPAWNYLPERVAGAVGYYLIRWFG